MLWICSLLHCVDNRSGTGISLWDQSISSHHAHPYALQTGFESFCFHSFAPLSPVSLYPWARRDGQAPSTLTSSSFLSVNLCGREKKTHHASVACLLQAPTVSVGTLSLTSMWRETKIPPSGSGHLEPTFQSQSSSETAQGAQGTALCLRVFGSSSSCSAESLGFSTGFSICTHSLVLYNYFPGTSSKQDKATHLLLLEKKIDALKIESIGVPALNSKLFHYKFCYIFNITLLRWCLPGHREQLHATSPSIIWGLGCSLQMFLLD